MIDAGRRWEHANWENVHTQAHTQEFTCEHLGQICCVYLFVKVEIPAQLNLKDVVILPGPEGKNSW